MSTLLLALAALLIAMIGNALLDPQPEPETGEARARTMEAIANSLF